LNVVKLVPAIVDIRGS